MRFFALFFAALFFSTPLFAATENTVILEQNPYSSFIVASTLYVISETGNIMHLISPGTNKFYRTIKLDNGPTRGLVYNGKIYVTNSEDRTVSVYYTTGTYKTLSVVGSGPIGMVGIGSRIYVASFDDKISVIDSVGDSRLDDTLLLAGGTPSEHMTVLGNRIFIHHPLTNSVSVFTTSGNRIIKNFAVGKSPQSSVLYSKSLFVINKESNDVTVINADTYETISTIAVGTGPTTGVLIGKKIYINNTLGNSVTVIDVDKKTVLATIPVGKAPTSFTVKDTMIFVMNKGDDTVSVIDTAKDEVIRTLPTGKEPTSATVLGTTLYVNNSGEKSLSYFSTTAPLLGLFTSSAASGEYRQGDKLELVASFNQKLAPGSTMTLTLNNGVEQTLSTIDGFFLRGVYTIGADQTVADLSVKAIKSANILGLYGITGTSYTLPAAGKNLGDLRNIVIKSGGAVATPVCQNRGYYRICPTTRPAGNIGEHQDALLCEGIISEAQTKRNYKRITRGDVLGIAVNMLRVPEAEVADYSGSFEDVTEPMQPMVQIALDRGLITNTRLFEPQRLVTRLEAYTLLMKGVCLNPVPVEGQNWTQAVYQTAYKAGVTNKTLSRFKPSATITKKEAFIIASQLADWSDTTGGCRPQVCK